MKCKLNATNCIFLESKKREKERQRHSNVNCDDKINVLILLDNKPLKIRL